MVALERISEAFRVLLWTESKENALSPIQIQMLIFLLFHTAEKCKISYLAQEFNLTKATVSDSVKVLLQKNLVTKTSDPLDTRSFSLALTATGRQTAEKSANFAFAIEQPLTNLTEFQKEAMLSGLLRLIYELNRAGVITLQRMCFTCTHFRTREGAPFCNLLQIRLAAGDLRIDCPEHQFARSPLAVP